MGSNQYWGGGGGRRVYELCVYFMTGPPEGPTERSFMEKPGIKPATPGLQDIGLSPTPRQLHSKRQEQEVSKAQIPPAVAIRGCNTFREKHVKDFIILNHVVSEKTLMTNVHMCYIGVTEGKIENLKKEGKMRISSLILIYTILFAYLKVYIKFHNPKSRGC